MQKAKKDNLLTASGNSAGQQSDYYSRLMEMLSSKICHDLVGPINALVNGIDLMSQEEGTELMGVIRSCADSAAARTRFYRLAYGRAGYQNVVGDEIIEITQGSLTNPQVRLNWAIDAKADLDDGWGKAALLVIQFFAQAAARGGEISVSIDMIEQRRRAYYTATGDNLIDIGEFYKIIAEEETPPLDKLTPHNAAACYLRLLIERKNWQAKLENKNNFISLSLIES